MQDSWFQAVARGGLFDQRVVFAGARSASRGAFAPDARGVWLGASSEDESLAVAACSAAAKSPAGACEALVEDGAGRRLG